MFSVRNQVVIQAPVAQVFAVDANPTQMPLYISSVVEVIAPDAGAAPVAGTRFVVRYGVAGLRFDSEAEVLRHEPNDTFAFKARGKVGEAVQTNTYLPIDDSVTEVCWQLDFTPANGVIARALAFAIRAELNESSFGRDLRRLKRHCEGR